MAAMTSSERQRRYRERKRAQPSNGLQVQLVVKNPKKAPANPEIRNSLIQSVLSSTCPGTLTHRHGTTPLSQSNPALYCKVIEMLQGGQSIRQVARDTGVSSSVVGETAIRELGPDYRRQFVMSNLWQLAELCSESLLNDVESMSPQARAVVAGIALDKLNAMSPPNTDHRSQTHNYLNVSAPIMSGEQLKKYIEATNPKYPLDTLTP